MTTENKSRAYAVGLPALVTISPDGFVTVSVDLSELGESIWEDGAAIDDDTHMAADEAKLRAWAGTHAVTGEGYADEVSA